jgi:hypothetical protein
VVLLVGIGWSQIFLIHVLQKISKSRLDLIPSLFIDLGIAIGVILVVSTGRIEDSLNCFVLECVFEKIVGLFLLHVPRRYLQSELFELETVHDVFIEIAKDRYEFSVGWVAHFKLPVRHLHTHFLAGDFYTGSVDDIKQSHEVILAAFAKIIGVDPECS